MKNKIADIIGEVVNQLVRFDLHLKHKKEFIKYFRRICDHPKAYMRKKACFNLPCMNLLFKSVE